MPGYDTVAATREESIGKSQDIGIECIMENSMVEVKVAFWNQENLFDTEKATRDAMVRNRLASELVGWNASVRDRKIRQMVRGIKSLFDGAGPDLLGVCEVENVKIVKQLARKSHQPGKSYQVVGHPSPDKRGIDVSFVYDETKLDLLEGGFRVVDLSYPTRDIFWARFKVVGTGGEFVAVNNHWPSRGNPSLARRTTARSARRLLYQLVSQREGNPDLPVIFMGDFNDNPIDASLEELGSTRKRATVMSSKANPKLLNLSLSMYEARPPGSYKYGSKWHVFDQFLVSRGMLLANSRVRVKADSIGIHNTSLLRRNDGSPRRHGRPASDYHPNGFSDHFPITVLLEA